jgi:signal transduction histidine kinase
MRLKNRAREFDNLDAIEDPVASDPGRRASGVQARAARSVSISPPNPALTQELPLISIGAPADPALLEPTYAYLSAYCFACLPPQMAQRLNVAIYELYANALRYGTGRGEVRIELRRNGGGIDLGVSNFAEPDHLARLKQQITRVQEDPSAAFSGEMNRFDGSSQPPPMLGLVRIAHEVSLSLDLRCDEQRVELSTHCEG